MLKPGISVVIPNFRGRKSVNKTLSSLQSQSLESSLFEIILIINGAEEVNDKRYSKKFPDLSIKCVTSIDPGVSKARNIGLALCEREFLTFVDDDDYLEPEFLEEAWRLSDKRSIVLMPIVDEEAKGKRLPSVNQTRFFFQRGRRFSLKWGVWALGFNSAKIIPTALAKRYRYDETLRSGEDVVYWSNYLNCPGLTFLSTSKRKGVSYVRRLTSNSVSRGKDSFSFNVVDRLRVIRALEDKKTESSKPQLEILIESQFAFITRFLSKHPGAYADSVESALKMRLANLPWEKIKPQHCDTLVVSYCFPPYADPAANVIAKRIAVKKEFVDVIFARMDRVRDFDLSTEVLTNPWTVRKRKISTPTSFSNWRHISLFARLAAESAKCMVLKNGRYQNLYTRALWPGSHVAGVLIKQRFPEIHWKAEFSDPMRYDSAGKHRSGQITSDRVAKRLFSVLKGTKFGDLEVSSHFDLIEISTLALADEIVFTNQKQLDVVLSAYPNELGNLIRHKSVVEGQPVLPDYYYGISNIAYCAPENKVNIAYFGNFYKNRGIGGVIRALSDLEATQKDRVRLHIFCSAPQELKKRIQNHGLENVVIVNNYVDYLDFLCLSKKFDVLVVEDVDTKQSGFIVNPYLPSKYLDYYGSNSRIWGIVEEGSVLSSRDLAFRSTVGNDVSIRNTLNLIIQTIGH